MSAKIIPFREKPKRETKLEDIARLWHRLSPGDQALIERLVCLLAKRDGATSPGGAS
jgi:hypothetical protein